MSKLQNKVAYITGAGSGIGKEIALLYAEEGAKVVVSDINEEAGNTVVTEITKKGSEAVFIKTNTANQAEVESLVKQTVDQFGELHIACNNAGIGGPLAPLTEYPPDGWDRVISINLSGVFYGMRYQIPALINSGGGCIVNMASVLGLVGTKNSSAY